MRSLLFSIAFIFTITFLFKHCSSQILPDDNKTFLDGHNAARRDVGVDPFTWDKKLEAYAKDFANKKKPSCSTDLGSKIPYGINLGLGYGYLTSGQTFNTWVGQKSDYNYTSNSCAKGKDCSAYTQIVWRKSVRLGCASVNCGLWPLFVCVYDPKGNIPGEKPY
ncbi:pathogenesis-related protein 1A1-like [Chenopodium quinoa]|uniref:pathogenesis-related protein 1A1-like n=1 Tax=Chenopodium quinoa TaxID=63459 RepID=UPI000B79602A|nr:pathogenesis-related protein 1A1-like [Chenopodium quinoa]